MAAATKVSEITKEQVAAYIRLDDASSSELELIEELLVVAKAYITSQTGLDSAGQDEYPDLMIVVKILCQDMYDNRAMYVDSNNVNQTVVSILGSHRQNFLPTPEVTTTTTEVPTDGQTA